MVQCLDAEAALDLLSRRSSSKRPHDLEQHIDGCAPCRLFLAEIVRAQAPNPLANTNETISEPQSFFVRSGQPVGRYVVLEMLGAGGMGVVYAAYDPELDRRIALKLVRNPSGIAEHAKRLRREAQAMAKVTHANVAQVFDVGNHGDEVFIAMEFIDGETLCAWLDNGHHSWQEIVDVFLKAGRGLSAAHRAGLVHRDFKPDNVLLAAPRAKNDARVCVIDFGLVFRDNETTALSPTESPPVPSLLSETGAVLGTPAYMAPEQMRGQSVGAHSDQFSFCVALFEALYGHRPFQGQTLTELDAAMESVQIQSVSKQIEPTLHAALLRGLRTDPEQRFPSMHDLLGQIESVRTPRRRMLPMILLASALVLILGVTWNATMRGSADTEVTCGGAREQLAAAWNELVRGAVEARASEVSSSVPTRERLLLTLENHSNHWQKEHVAACKATRVYGHQSERHLELRMACLDRNMIEFQAFVEGVVASETLDLDLALQGSTRLPSPQECANLAILEGKFTTLAQLEKSPQRTSLRRQLAAVKAQMNLGKTNLALQLAERLMPAVRTENVSSLSADAQYLLAQLLEDAGRLDEAKASYEVALPDAVAARDESLVATIWLNLMYLVGYEQKQHALGRELASVAKVAMGRAPDRDTLEFQLHSYLGIIARSEGDYKQAETELLLALEGYERLHGQNHPKTLQVLHNLGDVLQSQGRMQEANEILLQVLSVREEIYGSEHSSVAATLAQLGHYDYQRGNHRQALDRYQKALAIRRSSLGEYSSKVAASHTMVGSALRALGDTAAAREQHEQALSIWKRTLGPKHPRVALALNNLANTYYQEERLAEARTLFEEAYEIKKTSLGSDHPEVATSVFNLGEVVRAQDDSCVEARRYWQEALTIRENALDENHAHLAFPLTSLGACHVEMGTVAKARPMLERALTIRVESATDSVLSAETRFALAQALWPQPASRSRALQLAEVARTAFSATGNHKEQVAEVETWFAEVNH